MKYALRSLIRQPGFAIPVLLALALGIGANTAMFTVLNAMLLHPSTLHAWKNPGRVLTLWETNSHLSALFANGLPARPATYREWNRQSRSFESFAAFGDSNVTLTGNGSPEQVESGAASADLFPLVGVRMQVGRNFAAEENQPVTILSDELYGSRFHRDRNILGQTLTANGKLFTIIGVLPPGVAFPDLVPGGGNKMPKLWTPLEARTRDNEDKGFNLLVFARLKDGVSLAAAIAEMNVIESRLIKARKEDDGTGLNVIPLLDTAVDEDSRQALFVLQIAVGFVLLIACANAGNLMLAKSMSRAKDIAIRAAIGATRLRLIQQTFTECILLTVAATVMGLLFAIAALRVVGAAAPADSTSMQSAHLDGYVFAFTAAVSLLTAVLFGLAPAFFTRTTMLNQTLTSGSRTSTGAPNRLRAALAVTGIAMSLVLVMGAGLMLRSFGILMNTDLGFRIDRLLVMPLALPDPAYAEPAKVASFNRRLLDSVRHLKGIEAATLTTGMPMKALSQSTFEIPGRPKDPKQLPVTDWSRASDGYFATLRMPILRGRTFTREEAESENPAVAVVNEAFAAKHFPGENPLGKLVLFGSDKGGNSSYRIVGLVPNEHQMGPDNEQDPELYLPSSHLHDFLLVVRTSRDPVQLVSALKQQVWNIDKNQPIAEVMTEQAALTEWLAPRRFNMFVLLGFAAMAILLAATGLYSVLAYTVTLRTREIGIRIAVGASTGNIRSYILRGGLKLSVVGIVIGIAVSVGVTRFMASLIYGVDAFDPVTFGVAGALVLFISLAASYLPAMRAARVDPVDALRAE